MGAEFSISIAVPVRQPPGADVTGVGYCLPGDILAFDQEPKDRASRRGDADPAIRTVRRPGSTGIGGVGAYDQPPGCRLS